jgi:hypothetical protein
MPFTGKLRVAEAILIMQVITVIMVSIYIADIQYSRQINMANQRALLTLTNETAQLIEQQGDVSLQQLDAKLDKLINSTSGTKQ